jgi:hypothetical protein
VLDPNPYIRALAIIGSVGITIGVILLFIGFSFVEALIPASLIFALGVLAQIGRLVASAISWDANAIISASTTTVSE